MIATIPLATINKLNCFISARGMVTIIWHCALVLLICNGRIILLCLCDNNHQKRVNWQISNCLFFNNNNFFIRTY